MQNVSLISLNSQRLRDSSSLWRFCLKPIFLHKFPGKCRSWFMPGFYSLRTWLLPLVLPKHMTVTPSEGYRRDFPSSSVIKRKNVSGWWNQEAGWNCILKTLYLCIYLSSICRSIIYPSIIYLSFYFIHPLETCPIHSISFHVVCYSVVISRCTCT